MKKCLLLSALLAGYGFMMPIWLQAQNSTPAAYTGTTTNYTRTWDATAPEPSPTNLITRPLTDVRQTTEYIDGFGRPWETIEKQASPLGNDQVMAHYYDATGKETYQYLPFVSNAAIGTDVTNDGKFKADAFQQQAAFYNTSFTGISGATASPVPDASWPYSLINYETSPLNRVLTSYAPGVNGAGSQAGAPHDMNHQMLLNTATDNVQIWNIGAAQGSIPSSSGSYGAGQLYKTITTDEQGHQTIEYKDLYGQVVLKKVQNSASTDPGTGSAHSNWMCTYNVYDDYGNLRFIIPPAVVKQIDGVWNISQTLADELCYRFEYDLLNRMIIRKIPGTPSGSTGETWMVYDVRNRLVMSQDGNMRPATKWVCTLYDALDRQILTGTIIYAGTLSQVQQAVTTLTASENSSTIPSSTTVSGTGYSVAVNDFPLPTGTTITPLTITYYDNYNWIAGSGSGLSGTLDQTYTGNPSYFITTLNTVPTYAVQIAQNGRIQGQQTGKMVQVMGGSTTTYLYSSLIYDDHSRLIQSQSTNTSGGKDIYTSQYSWSSQVLRTLIVHNKSGTNPQTHLVGSAVTYDAMGRLLTIVKTVNSTINGAALNGSSTIVSKQYNELGALQKETLGNNIETLQYDYNIRGFLLGMNRAYAKTASSSANYFGYDLGYDQSAIVAADGSTIGSYATPTFAIIISGAVWKSRGDNQIRKYDYNYDPSNRLMGADFNQVTGGSFNKTAGLDFSVSGLGYDGNGNIQTAAQNGWLLGGSQQIDNLTYTYLNGNNSNRLMNVVDNSAYNASNPKSPLGDLHYAGSKTVGGNSDYGYDADINITSDFNRSINAITYDYLNQPLQFAVTNEGIVNYEYDALGNKLIKKVTDNSIAGKTITTTTTYIGGFVYKSRTTVPTDPANPDYTDALQYIGDQEGRIRALYANGPSPVAPSSYSFDYFINDHLGNVRMVLTDEHQQDVYPAATVETATFNGGTAESVESQYYSINTADIVATSTLPWFSAATNSSYLNTNGTPPNNDPNSNTSVNSAQVYRLNGQTGDKTGLGMTLKVMAGDQISIFGKSVWHNTGTNPGSFPISSALLTFLTPFTSSTAVGIGGHMAVTPAGLNGIPAISGPLTTDLNNTQNQPNPTVAPKAAINWILFNDQFVPVQIGSDLVSNTGDLVKSHADLNISMVANGYLYVYCSNESDIDVFFDNLQVVNTRGPILEETHYYPFGLAMAGISDKAWNKQQNFYHYQHNEMQDQEFYDGTGLEEYDFHARHYDQQLGVWHNQDPAAQYSSPYLAMGNNWPNGTDKYGKSFWNTVGTLGLILASAAAAYLTAGLSLTAEQSAIFGGGVLLGGYAGASLESGSLNPAKWNGDAWKAAITGEIVTASALVGVEAEWGGTTLVDALGAGGSNIAVQAAQSVGESLIGTEVADQMFGTHTNLTWNEAFSASVSGLFTGIWSGLNPVKEVTAPVGEDYYGLGLRTPSEDEGILSEDLNKSLFNLVKVSGGSTISSLLNGGSFKVNAPLGPLPFNVTFGQHQALLQAGPNAGELIEIGIGTVTIFTLMHWEAGD